ncbi:unnamed protein product [Acanthosepion pharaonis]|uniref:Reverse transcriptase domain-containing protein n=1 Tax=Acanthosepion pharaonis TaxID=158019 RepID=A0A812BXK9_ACAPH|nr:unnamed protein product [Sepia pharaonis]
MTLLRAPGPEGGMVLGPPPSGPADLPPRCSCPVCPCAFTRASSLTTHIWKKHPAEWNDIKKRRDASRRSNVRTYARWTREELERMAAIEHEALSKGVQHELVLNSLLARTRDQISCRRKKDDYKAILKSLESEAQCPGPDGSRARVVPDSPRNDHPTSGDLKSPKGRTGRKWSAEEIKVLQQAPRDVPDAELVPLLPGRTVQAIRSRKAASRRPKGQTGRTCGPGPTDEEQVTAEPQPYERSMTESEQGISDYLYGILPNIPDPVVREKAKQAIGDPNGFSKLYNEFFPKNRTVSRRAMPAVKVGVKRRRAQRAIIYNFLQNLHKRSPKSVAERVLDSDLSYEGLVAERAFSDEDFLRKWKPVFERPCYADLAGDHPGPPLNELAAPIKVADVAAVIASLKESSPGPDGLRLNILRGIPVEVITFLYNLLLLKGPPPTRGKAGNIFTSRVTFIKKVEVPGDALEFRPIAIGNYFVRIFHQVLASRFEAALPNHRDQVGFKRLDGVAHNVLKLNAALNAARSKHENLVVASVDIRKAFDSISHEAILGILQRKGVPDLLMGYLRTYFSTSRLQIGKDLIHPKHRGVKQGDPMSPWLFNLALDQILEGQEEYAITIGAIVLNQMAYADDLILFASSQEEMQKRIERLTIGLGRLGLELNARKCCVLSIRGDKKRKFSFVDTDVSISVDGTRLPVVTAVSEFRYLGSSSIGRAWPLTFGRLHKGELVKGDKAVRRVVRRWLRLPADCPNSAIHTPARFGGLGVNSLETLYSTLKESRLTQLSYGDEEDAAIASNPAVRGLMSYKFRGSVMSSREGLVEDLHRRLDTRGLQGYEKVPAVNSWLDHAPTNLAGHDFQEAIRVRLGCMGTPSRLSRGGRSVDTICKCGSNARMSLPHIAQACSIVSGLRIKRHNNVVLYVAQILKEKKYDVIMEPRLQTERGLRKPDLVILAKKEIIVLDVQIRPDSVVCTLDACNREKDREVQSAVRS